MITHEVNGVYRHCIFLFCSLEEITLTVFISLVKLIYVIEYSKCQFF